MSATYSAAAGRWVHPGELVHVVDPWGYYRSEPPAEFLGRDRSGHYCTADPATGAVRVTDWHVVRDVVPAVSA